ncbi:MAG: hypothetical protein HY336_02350 [Candidatus Doudnabacteria bacterium]|nr:hypothetical protein [Candidatus Doudnabacteria bacterium]
MHTYEIEIKSLLGSKENAGQLIKKMRESDPAFQSLGTHDQLNHYFQEGDTKLLYRNLVKYLDKGKTARLKLVLGEAKNLSVRTAKKEAKVFLVVKATIDDTTSSNGTARLEFESQTNLSLDELDKIVLASGFKYQAKWSRERQEFKFKDLNVTVDKNAGYGYLAEFEKIIDDPAKSEETKTSIRDSMEVLGVKELSQDRLERMFAFYNANWQDYYGTEKTFIID